MMGGDCGSVSVARKRFQLLAQREKEVLGKWGRTSLYRYFAFAALDRILFQPII
jgi:hypothetical protein